MKKHKTKIISGLIIAVILVFFFWYGGNAPGLRGWSVQSKHSITAVENSSLIKDNISGDISSELLSDVNAENTPENNKEKETKESPVKPKNDVATSENRPENPDNTPMTPEEKEALAKTISQKKGAYGTMQGSKDYSVANGMIIDETTGKDKYLTDPVPEGKPLPIEPQDVTIKDVEYTCTLSVKCDTILDNIAWLDKEKVDIVPKDGVIFAEKTVTFYEGESVFNLLLREMKRNNIHMEFVNTPIYNSAYIEGIANLYEFDCGELSGWMYEVNDWFPNYGCSRYQLKQGDRVEWVYTCDLGVDVGGYYAASGN